MRQKVVFFDWDGTLQDKKVTENANIIRNKLFGNENGNESNPETLRNNNNEHYENIERVIEKFIEINDKKVVREYQAVTFSYAYVKYVKENSENVLLFDPGKLVDIKERYSLKFVIVTSLYKGTIEPVLSILGVKELFDEVYSCPVDLSTTKFDNLKRGVEENKGNELLFMVGDRGEDINAGIKFGLETIHCNYGHGLDVEGATFVANSCDEVFEIIQNKLNTSN